MPMDFATTKAQIFTRLKELKDRQMRIPEEHKKLDEESAKNDWEIAGLETMLEGLEVATSNAPPDSEQVGITDKIRRILNTTQTPLVATQIRDLLMMQGVTGSSPKNLLISVHGVLTRIKDELVVGEREDGKTAYKGKVDLSSLQGVTVKFGGRAFTLDGAVSALGTPEKDPRFYGGFLEAEEAIKKREKK